MREKKSCYLLNLKISVICQHSFGEEDAHLTNPFQQNLINKILTYGFGTVFQKKAFINGSGLHFGRFLDLEVSRKRILMEPKIAKCFQSLQKLIHSTLNYSSLTGGALPCITQN